MNELLIIVDENDQPIGYDSKMKVHEKGLLHRAFSIFIYDSNTNKMLLQQRAKCKYHSGGLWTNACCSHPRKGETMQCAINNRLLAELGLSVNLSIEDKYDSSCVKDSSLYYCGKFKYYTFYGELSEHEIDNVFLWVVNTKNTNNNPVYEALSNIENTYNLEEAEDVKWISLEELDKWLASHEEDFTSWFKPAYNLAKDAIEKLKL